MTDPTPSDRHQMRRWLEQWARAGSALEDDRFSRLARLTDEEARALTRDLLRLWRPSELDEMGEELVAHQRWFAKAARATGRR